MDLRSTLRPVDCVVTIAVLAVKWFARPVATVYVALAAGVAVSAVYTQNDVAIESVAGIVYAMVLWALGSAVASVPTRVTTGGQQLVAARHAPDLEDATTGSEW